MALLTSNTKIASTSKEMGVKVMNFSIPAYDNKLTGKRTCPFAGSCASLCYAQKGYYRFSNVQAALAQKHEMTLGDNFPLYMGLEIEKQKPDFVRIHDSGDFYSPQYLEKWVTIARQNPGVNFYAYTKSVPFFIGKSLPDNMDICFSYGGTLDYLIDPSTHRHSRIFKSKKDLVDAGYVDASHNDLMATKWYAASHKIGLVFH